LKELEAEKAKADGVDEEQEEERKTFDKERLLKIYVEKNDEELKDVDTTLKEIKYK
jgi:hypothetical protein